MDRWVGRVAVVTGASAGIGAAIAKDLVEAGMKVVGLDLQKEKMQCNSEKMDKSKGGKLYPMKCDITKEQEILDTFSWVIKHLGGVDVLVNCAGIARPTRLTAPGNSDDLRSVLEVNVLGLCFCTREAFISMKERNVAGHIIHINSALGHQIPTLRHPFNMYCGTKYCVTALTEVLRQEMLQLGNKTKVTSISPSLVSTDFFKTAMLSESLAESLNKNPHLNAEDISQAILFCLGTPENVQVHELTIRAVGGQF